MDYNFTYLCMLIKIDLEEFLRFQIACNTLYAKLCGWNRNFPEDVRQEHKRGIAELWSVNQTTIRVEEYEPSAFLSRAFPHEEDRAVKFELFMESVQRIRRLYKHRMELVEWIVVGLLQLRYVGQTHRNSSSRTQCKIDSEANDYLERRLKLRELNSYKNDHLVNFFCCSRMCGFKRRHGALTRCQLWGSYERTTAIWNDTRKIISKYNRFDDLASNRNQPVEQLEIYGEMNFLLHEKLKCVQEQIEELVPCLQQRDDDDTEQSV